MARRRIRRFTPEQEQALGRLILEADARATAAIRPIPGVHTLLDKARTRSERTRGGLVQRLGEAVLHAQEVAREEPRWREAAREGRRAWSEAEALRWQLALTAKPIVIGEARKLGGAWLDEQDLLQEGCIGLLQAARRFDPDRGIRFHTYARWWVRAWITRAIDHTGRPIRLPAGAVEQMRNIRRVMESLDGRGGPWTLADVAREVGLEETRVQFLLTRGTTVSLDEPVDHDGTPRTVQQFLSDAGAPDPEASLALHSELVRMHTSLGRVLTERQRVVIVKRFGLDGGQPATLSEVGRRMRLSRERVRQLERQALTALREVGAIREHAA